MVFSSIPFLLLFLPAVLLLYFTAVVGARVLRLRRATGLLNAVLLVASLVFYAWGEPRLIVVMCLVAITDYAAGLIIAGAYRPGPVRALDPSDRRTPLQRRVLAGAIALNLGWLAWFKYAGFAAENVRAAAGFLGADTTGWTTLSNIALPLGISFYTFQSMSYTIDVYRGQVTATRNLLDFGCMVTMFAQLVAGPIIRYRDVAEQLRCRVVTLPLFAQGVRRFTIGLAKKTLVANLLAGPVDAMFALPASEVTTAIAWLAAIGYGLQIYFDFSGYSDMAIGLGHMFGFRFLENFNYPYIARSVTEFWRRWHISLSTWFRDYLYIPLGGNRHGEARTYRNLLIVFFLCGLWHGAKWTFVCWGLLHGAALVAERLGLGGVLARSPRVLQHGYTLLVVVLAWVLFRAPDLTAAGVYFRAMAGMGADGGLSLVAVHLTPTVWAAFVAGALCSTPVGPAITAWMDGSRTGAHQPRVAVLQSAVRLAGLAVLLAGVLVLLASGTYNPFIYFRF